MFISKTKLDIYLNMKIIKHTAKAENISLERYYPKQYPKMKQNT